MVKTWKELARQSRDKHRRTIQEVDFQLPDGRVESYSLFHSDKKSVCVLPLTDDGRVVLARQFRPGPGVVLDELPGGGVDDDETVETAIRRELLEETGYTCKDLVYLGRPYECGYSTVERHAFLATGCHYVHVQKLDQNEDIEVIVKPITEFVKQIMAGQCTDLEVAWMGLYQAGIIGIK